MKNLYISLLLFIIISSSAQCPVGNVTLSSQAEVNAFAVNFPNCTQITGNLYVTGSGITDLTPLSQINSVSGELAVYFSPSIERLNGLNGITSVGTISLGGNAILNDISALSNLTTVSNTLSVSNCPQLTSLNGLQGITATGGLVSLKGLGVTDLTGLNNLASIGFFLDISYNPLLTSLNGLNNLTSIGAYLQMLNNPLLIDLTGIANINPLSITALVIRNCTSLSYCSVASICYFVQNISGGTMTNNLPGCNNGTEISNVCNLGTEDLNAGKFAVMPNPTTDFLYITASDNAQATNFIVSDLSGKIILDAQNRDNKIDVSHLSNGLYILSIIGDRATSKIKFVKK
ncbi:MAG: T9SS type A sorting domain-containing protein [Burkholderiales bacterium]|nr:T9SS type A sorting domain-containing protein [Flavobacterium sp.]